MVELDRTQSVSYRLSRADVARASFEQIVKGAKNQVQWLVYRYVLYVYFLFNLITAARDAGSDPMATYMWYAVVIIVVALLGQIASIWLVPYVRACQVRGMFDEQTFTVTPGYAEVATTTSTRRIRWNMVQQMTTTNDLIMLVIATGPVIAVPVRAFASRADAAAMTAMAQTYRAADRTYIANLNRPPVEEWPPPPSLERVPMLPPGLPLEKAFKITFKTTRADYRWRFGVPLVLQCVGITVLFTIYSTALDAPVYGGFVSSFLTHAWLFEVLFLALIAIRGIQLNIAVNKMPVGWGTRVTTDDQLLRCEAPNMIVDYAVSSLAGANVGWRTITIRATPVEKIVIPKRVFSSPGQAAAFVARMRTAIAATSEERR